MGLKTTVGAYCFAGEKAKKTAVVIEQVCGCSKRGFCPGYCGLIVLDEVDRARSDYFGNGEFICDYPPPPFFTIC